MNALRLAKKELRKSLRQKISALPATSIIDQSQLVTESILSLPDYKKAKRLGIYLSMPKGEISTDLIVRNALQAGKQVFVPYIHKVGEPSMEAPDTIMDMAMLYSLDDYDTLELDAWGIPTPSSASIQDRTRCLDQANSEASMEQQLARDDLQMIIMPGMGFDMGFGRLGHGKGYYDNFLKRYQEKIMGDGNEARMPCLIGLALREQLLPPDQEVPRDATDWLLDALAIGDGSLVLRK